MKLLNFKTINTAVTFFALILSLVVTLYAFVPQLTSSLNPIIEKQIDSLLKEHESFVATGNIEGMMSLYHPEFSMDAIHSTGHKESFNKSQLLKHQEYIKRATFLEIEQISKQISVLNSNEALVSIIMRQDSSVNDLSVGDDKIYQTMLIVKHEGKPKILKVLSIAERS